MNGQKRSATSMRWSTAPRIRVRVVLGLLVLVALVTAAVICRADSRADARPGSPCGLAVLEALGE